MTSPTHDSRWASSVRMRSRLPSLRKRKASTTTVVASAAGDTGACDLAIVALLDELEPSSHRRVFAAALRLLPSTATDAAGFSPSSPPYAWTRAKAPQVCADASRRGARCAADLARRRSRGDGDR